MTQHFKMSLATFKTIDATPASEIDLQKIQLIDASDTVIISDFTGASIVAQDEVTVALTITEYNPVLQNIITLTILLHNTIDYYRTKVEYSRNIRTVQNSIEYDRNIKIIEDTLAYF